MDTDECSLEILCAMEGNSTRERAGGRDRLHLARAPLLRIRDRNGAESKLNANPVQAEFARRRGRQNIVVKARQMASPRGSRAASSSRPSPRAA